MLNYTNYTVSGFTFLEEVELKTALRRFSLGSDVSSLLKKCTMLVGRSQDFTYDEITIIISALRSSLNYYDANPTSFNVDFITACDNAMKKFNIALRSEETNDDEPTKETNNEAQSDDEPMYERNVTMLNYTIVDNAGNVHKLQGSSDTEILATLKTRFVDYIASVLSGDSIVVYRPNGYILAYINTATGEQTVKSMSYWLGEDQSDDEPTQGTNSEDQI